MLTEESRISNLSTEKQDDGDIRCPNCYWYFSVNTKPYILPCFHNLCDKCINNLIQQKNPKCPVCSKIFTHNGENPFQVNFGYLNLVTKILTNKIIFCKKCYKIYYWNNHYTSCNQEDFIETYEIFNDIKNTCENGLKIINLLNDKNNNTSILNKYKNEIMVLLKILINKIRKKNKNKIKRELDKLFTESNKEKFEFNFQDIKQNIINFLLICLNYSEYFDKKEIINSIKPYIPMVNKQILHKLNNRKDKINTNYYMSSNITISKQRKKFIKDEKNKYNHENTTYVNTKNNRKMFTKTPKKIKINFDNKINKIIINNYKEKSLNKSLHKANIVKLDNHKCISDNKRNKKEENKNEQDNESDDELIYNFDDEYHDNDNDNEVEINKKIKDKNNSRNKIKDHNINNFMLEGMSNKKNKKTNIKDIFEKSIFQDTKIEKKIIIGLNEIKVISLKKKILNRNLSSQDIIKNNKMLLNTKQNEGNIHDKKYIKTNNSRYKELTDNNSNVTSLNKKINIGIEKNNKLRNNNNTNRNQNIISPVPPLNILLSSNLIRSSEHLFMKNNNKNIKKYVSPKINTHSTKNKCSLSINDLKIKNGKDNINVYLFNKNKKNTLLNTSNSNSNNIIKKKPFINISNINNINNDFFDNKKNINNLSNPNIIQKSMSKIFKNFNNIKDIISNIKEYTKITKYINTTINNTIDKSISLLKDNISEDYNLILYDVVNNYCNLQRNFLFSFKNNTKSIILFNIEYNNFISLDLSSILTNFPNFNSSMQFEFIDNNNNYLLFITGGNERTIKDNSKYSSDSFMIMNIKLNINMNSKNKTDYTKKYIIEYKDKMPSSKSHHSILFFNHNLYIIGGYDNNKIASRECFYFSYENKNWCNMPKLNVPRANCSMCLYNKSFLYLFRGRNNEGLLNSIECLNINNIHNNNWKIINVVDYGFVWDNIYNSCTVPLEENRILIFGGEDENKLYRESFLFDIKNNNIYRGMDLKIPAAFNGQGIYYNGKIYGFDFKNKNGDYEHKLHIFDIRKNDWTINYFHS